MNLNRIRFLAAVPVLGVGLILSSGAVASESPLFFFDPAANHQAIVQMANSFNSFLKRSSVDLVLQPVQHAEQLASMSSAASTGFGILAAEYLAGHSGWTPLLVPSRGGDIFYNRWLVSRTGMNQKEWQGKTIAATIAVGEERRGSALLLDEMARAGLSVSGARVLKVAKDIDGLLALAFGSADAAVVTDESIALLGRLNASLAGSLERVAPLAKVMRSPLCAGPGIPRERQAQVVAAFEAMSSDEDGARVMRALAIDKWVPYVRNIHRQN